MRHDNRIITPMFELKVSPSVLVSIDAVLHTPILVELVGAGFDINRYSKDYVLRFPRVMKVHTDRDWKDAVSSAELQAAARKALSRANDDEVHRWKDALEVVDRMHAADGTILPSDRVGESARRSLDRTRTFSYGVEMRYGLDIDELLRIGEEIGTKRTTEEEDPQSLKSSCSRPEVSHNKGSQQLVTDCSATQKATGILQLLSSATVVIKTKTHQEEILRRIPSAISIDWDPSDKENARSKYRSPTEDTVVLVNKCNSSLVRSSLTMAQMASEYGSRWHVYNWRAVLCMDRKPNTDWENERLRTYIGGKAC